MALQMNQSNSLFPPLIKIVVDKDGMRDEWTEVGRKVLEQMTNDISFFSTVCPPFWTKLKEKEIKWHQ